MSNKPIELSVRACSAKATTWDQFMSEFEKLGGPARRIRRRLPTFGLGPRLTAGVKLDENRLR